ncbi:hypothetical protein TcasGA2_TC008866 [Tribolium castaneum]|uniref:Uncharacterized protein n=1 Tax=Tribolium castaneum TaxID=7070 RepID=D6WQR5_TRICA|nr:hypothetical protein TcasGA2_TC008866 [Tribolium castaneum]
MASRRLKHVASVRPLDAIAIETVPQNLYSSAHVTNQQASNNAVVEICNNKNDGVYKREV